MVEALIITAYESKRQTLFYVDEPPDNVCRRVRENLRADWYDLNMSMPGMELKLDMYGAPYIPDNYLDRLGAIMWLSLIHI